MHDPDNITLRGISIIKGPWLDAIEMFSIDCRKTKTKLLTYQLDYSANLKPW